MRHLQIVVHGEDGNVGLLDHALQIRRGIDGAIAEAALLSVMRGMDALNKKN